MSESVFKAELLRPDTWMIHGDGCTAYLVVGENTGVMIDSGEAAEDLRAFVKTLTDKEVSIVLNTHGHFDHTGANGFFDCAFMGNLAQQIAKIPNGPRGAELLEKLPMDYPIVIIEDGFKMDLGGRVIEAFMFGGHSPDSIVYLDHREKILFGGDNIGNVVPLKFKCVDPQPSILLYVMSLSKIMAHRDEFDFLCTGHGQQLLDASVVDHCMIAALRALDGEQDEEPPRPPRPGRENGPFALHDPANKGFIQYKDARIMFDKRYVTDPKKYDTVIGT